MPTTTQAKKAWDHMRKGKAYYEAMTPEQKAAGWQYGRDSGLFDVNNLDEYKKAEFNKYVKTDWVRYAPDITPSKVADVLKYDSHAADRGPKVPLVNSKPATTSVISTKRISGRQLEDMGGSISTPKPPIRTNPLDRSQEQYSEGKTFKKSDAILSGLANASVLGAAGKGIEQELKPGQKGYYIAGNIAGSIMPGTGIANLAGKGLAKLGAKKLVQNLGGSAIAGAAMDTTQGAMEGDSGKELAVRVGRGAVIGLVADGALMGLGAAGKGIMKKLADKKALSAAEKAIVDKLPAEAKKEITFYVDQYGNVKNTPDATLLLGEGKTVVPEITNRNIDAPFKITQLEKAKIDSGLKQPKINQGVNTLPIEKNLGINVPTKPQNAASEMAATVLKEPPRLGGKLSQVDADLIAEKASMWKDKPQKLAYKRETMERNLMDIIPDKVEAKQMVDTYIEPIRKNEAESIRNINTMRNEVKQLGIKPFSKESELVQKYGEGLISKEDLAKETANPEKVIKAADHLRAKYNELLDKANKVLEANGYKPIARRPNYMPHQGEIQTVMQMIGIENPELPTDINGLTDMFVPGKNFFANALQRKGDKTAYDAIRGFDNYVEGINKIIYQTPNIKRIRQLETTLRKKFEGTTHLSNFVGELREYGNLLSGKKSKLDRGAEEFVGRQIYKVADTIRKQLGANMVGGNVSSALTNFIPLTQTMGTVDKGSFVEAMAKTIGNVFKDDGFIDQSDYLVRRFGSDRLALTNWQKAGKTANWMFQVVDGFTSQVITRAKYLENIKQGLDHAEALKEAGAYAGKVMADRSAGQIPTLFASKTLAPLNMFQIEVNNQISHLFKDLPREYAKNKPALASMYAQIALYSYVFNNLYEKATGRRPAFDIIGVAQKAYQDYNNDNLTIGKANKNTIQNIANQLPFTSVLTGGRIPMGNAFPDLLKVASGEADIKKEIKKPLFNLLPPTGGAQINKTIQGLSTYNKGGAYNDSGTQLKFPVEKNKPNLARSALFGMYSTPESKKYYDNARTPLSENQTSQYEKQVKAGKGRNEAYEGTMKERKTNSIKLKISKIRNDKTIEWEDKMKQIKELQNQIKELNKR
jgi:hypothetical protein